MQLAFFFSCSCAGLPPTRVAPIVAVGIALIIALVLPLLSLVLGRFVLPIQPASGTKQSLAMMPQSGVTTS